MSLSKLFQMLIALHANVRRPVAVLDSGICNKSRLRVWQAWMLERKFIYQIFRCEAIETFVR